MSETPNLQSTETGSSQPKQAMKSKELQNEVHENNENVEWGTKNAKKVISELADHIKDDEALATCWQDLVEDCKVMWRGNQKSMKEMVANIRSLCKIDTDINLHGVRSKEAELGNLMAAILTELALAQTGRDALAERKKDYLADAKDRRKSQAVIEAELVKISHEYKLVRNIAMSADLNYKFWKAMHSMVDGTLNRLKQISITLTAEMRLERGAMPNVPSIGTERRDNRV